MRETEREREREAERYYEEEVKLVVQVTAGHGISDFCLNSSPSSTIWPSRRHDSDVSGARRVIHGSHSPDWTTLPSINPVTFQASGTELSLSRARPFLLPVTYCIVDVKNPDLQFAKGIEHRT